MKARAHVSDEKMQMFSMAVLEKAIFHMNNTKEQKNWNMRYNEREMYEESPSYHLLNVTNWTTVITQTESKYDKKIKLV